MYLLIASFLHNSDKGDCIFATNHHTNMIVRQICRKFHCIFRPIFVYRVEFVDLFAIIGHISLLKLLTDIRCLVCHRLVSVVRSKFK